MTMAKNGGPVDVYMEAASAVKFKLRGGRGNYISSYVFFYKRQVFDMMLAEVAKLDSSLTPDKVSSLKVKIDSRYTKIINSYLGLNLKEAPNIANYQTIEKMVIDQTLFDHKNAKKEIKDCENVKSFIESKKNKQEWVDLASGKGKSQFFLTDHGLYEVSDKKIVGLALFNRNELEDYKANNKMLSIFMEEAPLVKKSGCIAYIKDFF